MLIAAAVEEEDLKGVPSFWLQALANHPVTAEILQQEDTTALESLQDIKIEYDETYNTFTLSFEFQPNEFFTNTVCTFVGFVLSCLSIIWLFMCLRRFYQRSILSLISLTKKAPNCWKL